MNETQARRLIDLVTHARATTTYYGSVLPTGALLPREPSALLASIPILERSEIQQAAWRFWSSEGDPAERCMVRTTGTTGEPVEVLIDGAARWREAVSFARHVDEVLGTCDWRQRPVHHVVLHPEAVSIAVAAAWTGDAGVVKWNLTNAWEAGGDTLRQASRHLSGCVMTAMPSVASTLIDGGTSSFDETSRPSLIVLAGETVTPDAERRLNATLNCPTTRAYTLAEAGIVATGCIGGHGYHVDTAACVVEILDSTDQPVLPGEEGSIVVTPLANRAMPLLRYRTGDRGRWLSAGCPCGRLSSRFCVGGRAEFQRDHRDAPVRVQRLFSRLPVRRVVLESASPESVVVRYEGARRLSSSTHAAVAAGIQRIVGPHCQVDVRRSQRATDSPLRGTLVVLESTHDPAAIAAWLAETLQNEHDIVAAVLTGSVATPALRSRYSDVDAVVLVQSEPSEEWHAIARNLRSLLPSLNLNVDSVLGFTRRAPLVACRLLSEQVPIIGRLDESLVPWPGPELLARERWFWRQGAIATLSTRLANPQVPSDIVHEAWLASKFALDALRYYYLVRSGRETAADALLARAEKDGLTRTFADAREGFEVSREFRPPSHLSEHRYRRFLLAALDLARLE